MRIMVADTSMRFLSALWSISALLTASSAVAQDIQVYSDNSIEIIDDASPQPLNLTDYGIQPTGQTQFRAFSIRNTHATNSLNISAMGLTGSNPDQFSFFPIQNPPLQL